MAKARGWDTRQSISNRVVCTLTIVKNRVEFFKKKVPMKDTLSCVTSDHIRQILMVGVNMELSTKEH